MPLISKYEKISPTSYSSFASHALSDSHEERKSQVADSEESGICHITDGTHSATVEYHNPGTGYDATYTLDVEVSDCQVIQINFTNGGYLDEDHITAADINENGDAHVEGEEGKTYDVHIDN